MSWLSLYNDIISSVDYSFFLPRQGRHVPGRTKISINEILLKATQLAVTSKQKLSASITRFFGGVNILEYILVNFKDTNHVLECLAVQFSSYMELKLIKVMKPSCVYRWLS